MAYSKFNYCNSCSFCSRKLLKGTISQVVTLATFMPIVAGMGGNAGTQSLTIVVRGICIR